VTLITLQGGLVVLRGGLVGTEQACCCGEDGLPDGCYWLCEEQYFSDVFADVDCDGIVDEEPCEDGFNIQNIFGPYGPPGGPCEVYYSCQRLTEMTQQTAIQDCRDREYYQSGIVIADSEESEAACDRYFCLGYPPCAEVIDNPLP